MKKYELLCIFVCAIGASSCRMLPQDAKNYEAGSLSNNSVFLHKIESQAVARLLLAFSESTHPLIDLQNASRCTVIELMEYMLSAGFEVNSIQHPIISFPASLHEDKITLREAKISYLLAFCKLAHVIGLHFGIHKNGKLIVLSENDNVKDVYFVSVIKDDSEARIIGVRYNRGSVLLKLI